MLHGRVLNVSNFLSQRAGGELAILTLTGKHATAEFDMIHPLDVVKKKTTLPTQSSVHLGMEERMKTMKKMMPPKEVTPWKRLRSTTRKVMCG